MILCAAALWTTSCASDALECGTWKIHGTVVGADNKPAAAASVAAVSSCTLPSQTLAGRESFHTTKTDGAFSIDAAVCRAGGLEELERLRFVACLPTSACQCQEIDIDVDTPGVTVGKVKPDDRPESPRVISHGYDPKMSALYLMFSTEADATSVVVNSTLKILDKSGNCDKVTITSYLGLATLQGNLLELVLPRTTCISNECWTRCYTEYTKCLDSLSCSEDASKCSYNCDVRCTYPYNTYRWELGVGWYDKDKVKGKAATLEGTLLPGK